MERVRALFFDVFGTLVDWRGSIAREARAILSPLGVALDWEAFADAWRDQYQPAMDEVRSGRLPFSKLDVLHRRNLDVILQDFRLGPAGTDEGRATFVGPRAGCGYRAAYRVYRSSGRIRRRQWREPRPRSGRSFRREPDCARRPDGVRLSSGERWPRHRPSQQEK